METSWEEKELIARNEAYLKLRDSIMSDELLLLSSQFNHLLKCQKLAGNFKNSKRKQRETVYKDIAKEYGEYVVRHCSRFFFSSQMPDSFGLVRN